MHETGAVVFPERQTNITLASDLSVRRQRPLLQALAAPELPYHPVLLQHVLDDGFAFWTDPALSELLLQQHEVVLDPLQTLVEVEVDLLPQELVLFGLAGSPVLTLDDGSSGDGERSGGGEEQLVVALDAAQEPRELRQGHFSGGVDDSLLRSTTQRKELSYLTKNILLPDDL